MLATAKSVCNVCFHQPIQKVAGRAISSCRSIHESSLISIILHAAFRMRILMLKAATFFRYPTSPEVAFSGSYIAT
jgi:hypothetical protein